MNLFYDTSTYMFLDNQILDSFHNKVGAVGHQFGEHVDRLSSTSSVLAGASGNLGARSEFKKIAKNK